MFDESRAGPYYVSLTEGHRLLANFGWSEQQLSWHEATNYTLSHLVTHLAEAGRVEKAVDLVLDLNWLEAKNQRGLTFSLLHDFASIYRTVRIDHPQRVVLPLIEE